MEIVRIIPVVPNPVLAGFQFIDVNDGRNVQIHFVLIQVDDNGMAVAEEIASRMFLAIGVL